MSIGGPKKVTYQHIVEAACDKNGRAEEDLSDYDRRRMQRSVQDALEYIWNFDVWPDLRNFVRCTYHPDYDATETLASGDIRYSGVHYWKALEADPGEEPSEDSTKWERFDVVEKLIAWDNPTEEISIPKAVYGYDPLLEKSGEKYSFVLTEDGLHLEPAAANEVWVEYMPHSPVLRADDWDAEVDYKAGESAYYRKEGDFFVALSDNKGVTPGSDSAVWDRTVIPPRFNQYLQWVAAARELSAARQSKEAAIAESKAMDHLYRAIDMARGMTGAYGEQFIRGGNY